jgi:hypothetical protein
MSGWSLEYSFDVDVENQVVYEKIDGIWKEETAREYNRDFLEEVEPLLKKPWVKLVDLRGWRTSYPQMVNVIGDHLKWCKAHNMGLSLNVLNNPSTFRQLNEMFRYAGTREMSETFRTFEEAEKFLKENWLDLEVKDRLVKKR